AWRSAKAVPRRWSRLNTATNCAPSVACTAGANAWSAMLPVPKRAIPRGIVSVSSYQDGERPLPEDDGTTGEARMGDPYGAGTRGRGGGKWRAKGEAMGGPRLRGGQTCQKRRRPRVCSFSGAP